jgi:hypothetical protein
VLAIFGPLKSWLDQQAKLRKDEFIANAPMSRAVRVGGALIPAIAFFIVVSHVYSSANERSVLSSTGVRVVDNWQWQIKRYDIQPKELGECHQTQCWNHLTASDQLLTDKMPSEDPIGSKQWAFEQPIIVTYTAMIPKLDLEQKEATILYLPGIRSERVSIWWNQQLLNNSKGNLPFFIDLSIKRRNLNQLVIVNTYLPNRSYQGFITRNRFVVGDVLSVYRTHHRLTDRSFPRRAVVIFLLAIGALTFAFFVFLDHKRELFALGLTISLLGAALAVYVGMIDWVGPDAFFVIFTFHITALFWYATELVRINVGIPKKTFMVGLLVTGLYFASQLLPADVGKSFRYGMLMVLDFVPIALGMLCVFSGILFFKVSRERAVQLLLSALGMLVYGAYLLGSDFELIHSPWVRASHQIPVMAVVTLWIIAALSSLGSMEKRVKLAIKDREQQLKLEHEIVLAQEVQKSFILSGRQQDKSYDVMTVYQAVKKVGGDWVTWVPLPNNYSLGIIGDVVGKGIQAGLIVSACDSILRNCTTFKPGESVDPQTLIQKIVDSLYISVFKPHEKRAMTLAIMVLDNKGKLTYTTLGHPPLLVIGDRGVQALMTRNTWLSPQFLPANLLVKQVEINPKETLVGYTDGICDGSRELRKFKARIAGWHHRNLESIEDEFLKIIPDYDDQTLILLRLSNASS